MNYADTAGNPTTGIVWSPGPLPGTVWVLPYSGASASEARVVHVQARRQATTSEIADGTRQIVCDEDGVPHYVDDDDENGEPIEAETAQEAQSVRLRMFSYAPELPAKDWHAALGYDPRDVVRRAAAGSAPTAAALMLDLAIA